MAGTRLRLIGSPGRSAGELSESSLGPNGCNIAARPPIEAYSRAVARSHNVPNAAGGTEHRNVRLAIAVVIGRYGNVRTLAPRDSDACACTGAHNEPHTTRRTKNRHVRPPISIVVSGDRDVAERAPAKRQHGQGRGLADIP